MKCFSTEDIGNQCMWLKQMGCLEILEEIEEVFLVLTKCGIFKAIEFAYGKTLFT